MRTLREPGNIKMTKLLKREEIKEIIRSIIEEAFLYSAPLDSDTEMLTNKAISQLEQLWPDY